MAMSVRRRDRPSIVVETHGDWRTAARLGGSRLRFLFAPVADWAARYALAVRTLEAVNTEKLVDLYVRYYPLFQEAYKE